MKYNWEKDFLNLGEGKVGDVVIAEFKYLGDTKEVVSMKASCDCTDLKFDRETGILSVTYKAEKIPQHLVRIGYFTPHKNVKVKYDTGHEVTLTFKIIIRNG